jgi:hypothetical protein
MKLIIWISKMLIKALGLQNSSAVSINPNKGVADLDYPRWGIVGSIMHYMHAES